MPIGPLTHMLVKATEVILVEGTKKVTEAINQSPRAAHSRGEHRNDPVSWGPVCKKEAQ